jgi:hypothetical protein
MVIQVEPSYSMRGSSRGKQNAMLVSIRKIVSILETSGLLLRAIAFRGTAGSVIIPYHFSEKD